MGTLQIGVLVSGTGTNLQAILDGIAEARLDAQVRLVVSNKPGVVALERAERAGVPTCVLRHKDFASREAFDEALVAKLVEAGVQWVVLAGFMRILTPVFLNAFPMRVINIHPALLPSFPGVDAQAQAIAYGVRISGCTVHLVDAGTDTGPILAQAAVAVAPDDTRDTLAKRILAREHELLVSALGWLAEGRVRIESGDSAGRARVVVQGACASIGVDQP